MTETYKHTPGAHFEQHVQRQQGQRRKTEQQQTNGHDGAEPGGSLFVRTGDKFAAEYQPLEYVIDGILPKGTLVTITGPGNIGKTALGMMIAAHKANGRDLGAREVLAGHVVYASAENTTDFRHRYIAMRDNWQGFAEGRFHVITSDERAGLTANADRIEAYALALGITFDLIVVDTQAAWSLVEEEANNAEQLAYARALRRLCRLPGLPAVLVLSHPTKTPTKAAECRPRGGVAFENETDANMTLWPVNASDPSIVEVAYTRLRVPRWEPFCIRMAEIETTSVVDNKGRPIRSVWAMLADADETKAARAAKPAKEKTKAELARDVLFNTLADFSQFAPNKRTMPTDRQVVLTKHFRARLLATAVTTSDRHEPGQWRDITLAMQKKGWLRIDGDYCWSPS